MKIATVVTLLLLASSAFAAPSKNGSRATAAPKAAAVIAPDLSRLDPHGDLKADLQKHVPGSRSECNVCHVGTAGWKALKADVSGVCTSCHGKTPHSGVLEHMGKEFKLTPNGLSGKMDCMSCHSPHRADALETRPAGESIISAERRELNAELMIQKRASFAMLRRNCQECHPWK